MERFEDLVRAWLDAEASGDVERLAVLLDEDFRGDGPAGFVLDKPTWVDRHRADELHYDTLMWQATDVRVSKHSAIGTGVLSQRRRGEPNRTDYVCTIVASRGASGWTIVNIQLRHHHP